MKLPQRRLYIALEGFDFGWNPELERAVRQRLAGAIAKKE
jgi:hypothetical protein